MVAGRARRLAGMTLTEVMVAMGLSLMALMAVQAHMLTLFHGAALARNLTEASTLVQSRLEEILIRTGVTVSGPAPPNGTSVETGLDGLGRSGAGASGMFTRATTWSVSADGQRRVVTVVVSWTDARGTQHSVTGARERVP